MNLLEILNFSKEYLQKYSFSKPRLESEKVISNVLKLDRITLYAYFDMELSSEQKEKVKTYLKEMARKRIGFDELLKSEDIKVENISYKKENLELLDKEGLESCIVLWHNNPETNICFNSSRFSFVSQ